MAIVAALAIAQTVDPYNLPIGTPGTFTPHPGYNDARTGKQVSAADIAKACNGVQYVLVGESHATPPHHAAQAEVIRALVAQGRHVAVGMEMFTRENQRIVNGLSGGKMSLDEFRVESNWDKQWGHDYKAYTPVLQAVKDLELPIIALNVPRDWVRQVSRQGYDSFDEMQRKWVPQLDLTNANHRKVFDSLMGGHPMPEEQMRNIYAGQVTWDTGMAKTALDWMSQRSSDKWVVVILAGIGHVMYGQAINYRLEQLAGAKSVSVVCVSEMPSGKVAKGLGDYVFLSE